MTRSFADIDASIPDALADDVALLQDEDSGEINWAVVKERLVHAFAAASSRLGKAGTSAADLDAVAQLARSLVAVDDKDRAANPRSRRTHHD